MSNTILIASSAAELEELEQFMTLKLGTATNFTTAISAPAAKDIIENSAKEPIFMYLTQKANIWSKFLRELPAETAIRITVITENIQILHHALQIGRIKHALSLDGLSEVFANENKPSEEEIPQGADYIIVNRHDKTYVLPISEILMIEADGAYSNIYHMRDKMPIRSSKALGSYVKQLTKYENISRISKSIIFNFSNIYSINQYVDGAGEIEFRNGFCYDVSRVHKNRIISEMQMKMGA